MTNYVYYDIVNDYVCEYVTMFVVYICLLYKLRLKISKILKNDINNTLIEYLEHGEGYTQPRFSMSVRCPSLCMLSWSMPTRSRHPANVLVENLFFFPYVSWYVHCKGGIHACPQSLHYWLFEANLPATNWRGTSKPYWWMLYMLLNHRVHS